MMTLVQPQPSVSKVVGIAEGTIGEYIRQQEKNRQKLGQRRQL